MSEETTVTPKATRGKNDAFIFGDVFKHNDFKFQCQIVDNNTSLKDLTKYRIKLLHNGVMTQLTRCCIQASMTFVENRA